MLKDVITMGRGDCMSSCIGDTCRIDAVISMDVKGQIVLPKDLREKANFKPNDKIAVVAVRKRRRSMLHYDVKSRKTTGCCNRNAWSIA